MHRAAIMIVDPARIERESFIKCLSVRFDPIGISSAAEALDRFTEIRPAAVIATLKQSAGHGFELCRDLRALPEGEHTVMFVFGDPGGDRTVDRVRVQKKWGVEHFALVPPDPEGLESLVWHEVIKKESQRRLASAGQNARPEAPSGKPGLASLFKRQVSLKALKSVFSGKS